MRAPVQEYLIYAQSYLYWPQNYPPASGTPWMPLIVALVALSANMFSPETSFCSIDKLQIVDTDG